MRHFVTRWKLYAAAALLLAALALNFYLVVPAGVGVPGGHLSEQLLGIVLIAGAALRVLLHSRGWTRGSSSGTASVTEK